MNFTTYVDTACYTAEAATAADAPAHFNVAGDTLDFHGLGRAYAAGSGRSLGVDCSGLRAQRAAVSEGSRQPNP